jgi:hypothetical protein
MSYTRKTTNVNMGISTYASVQEMKESEINKAIAYVSSVAFKYGYEAKVEFKPLFGKSITRSTIK